MKKSVKKSVKKCRVVVMGASGVGKTSLISQFVGTGFPEKHEETVEEMYHSELTMSTVNYNLEILDTTGTFCFPAMKRLAIAKADVFVLVFSLDCPKSLHHLRLLKEEIVNLRGESCVPILVAANKGDISEVPEPDSPREYASALVTLDWDCQFIETSAKTNSSVIDLFQTAVSMVHNSSSPPLSPASSFDECSREC